MNSLFPSGSNRKDQVQSRLFGLATLVLVFYSAVLTLSPAVRLHTWQVEYRWVHWAGLAAWLAGTILLHQVTIRKLPDRDPYLLPIAALLSGLGLLSIWRLDTTFGWRQTAWLTISMAAFGLLVYRRNTVLSVLRRYKYIWLTGGLLITGLTLVFGTYPGGIGPHLWLGCCGVYFQPSEPLKLLLIVYLAAYLADRSIIQPSLLSLILPTLILAGGAFILLIAQRDLGTATLLFVLYAVFIYLTSGHRRILIISGIFIIAAGFVGYRLFDVIQIRVGAWLNPWIEAGGRSYQIVQSLISVASGSILGSGPGLGSPSVVPVAHSDFIFSAIAEELGLVGTFGVLLLLGLLMVRGMVTAIHAPNHYQRLLAAGIIVNGIVQSILIIAGNLRLLPLTGVTLPFVSYGGSSLLTSFIGLTLLLLISSHPDRESAPLPDPKPYLVIGSLLLAGLFALGTMNIYWGFIRSENLQSRPDNPRWAITEMYAPRGNIYDRNNQPIAITSGIRGDFTRELLFPQLSPIIGYSTPMYGQAGIEQSLDTYLRGLAANSSSTVAYYQILHNQTPPGLDIRLSIDLRIQQKADELLNGKTGALVILNSDTGEILAMSSHPGFDSNQLNEKWQEWIKDTRGIFINRATQGQYPPGAALGPFIMALYSGSYGVPTTIPPSSYQYEGNKWDCAVPVSATISWGELISNGCPGAIYNLTQNLRTDQIILLFHQLGLDRTPQINMPVISARPISSQDDSIPIALGQSQLEVSPLQLALAAAALNPNGTIPAPLIVSSVRAPDGWILLPGSSVPIQPALTTRTTVSQLLQLPNLPAWGVTATAQSSPNLVTWFLAGTMSDWQGSPITLALVIEGNEPAETQKIGTTLLQKMLLP